MIKTLAPNTKKVFPLHRSFLLYIYSDKGELIYKEEARDRLHDPLATAEYVGKVPKPER